MTHVSFSDALVVTVVSVLGPRLAGEPRRETRIRGSDVEGRLRATTGVEPESIGDGRTPFRRAQPCGRVRHSRGRKRRGPPFGGPAVGWCLARQREARRIRRRRGESRSEGRRGGTAGWSGGW